MPSEGRPIRHLDQKLKTLAEFACHIGKCDSSSIVCLEKAAGFGSSTLHNSGASQRITPYVERRLADFIQFDLSHYSWRDTSVRDKDRLNPGEGYKGSDCAEHFEAYIKSIYEKIGKEGRKLYFNPPIHSDTNTLTFSLDGTGQVVGVGTPLSLFFSIVVKPAYCPDGLVYGFTRVRLTFRRDDKTSYFVSNILGSSQKEVRIKNAILEARGGRYNPEWFLRVEGKILDDEYCLTEDPICDLEGISVGEDLIAEVAVNQHDGSLVDGSTGKALSDSAKAAVLEALCACQLRELNEKPSAWLVLGRQRIKVVYGV